MKSFVDCRICQRQYRLPLYKEPNTNWHTHFVCGFVFTRKKGGTSETKKYRKVCSCHGYVDKLFWDKMRRLVNRNRRLTRPCYLHPQPLLILLILKTASASHIETTVRVFANRHGVTTQKTWILKLRERGEWLLTVGLTSFRLLWKDDSNSRVWSLAQNRITAKYRDLTRQRVKGRRSKPDSRRFTCWSLHSNKWLLGR
jgi:hypothetical protein